MQAFVRHLDAVEQARSCDYLDMNRTVSPFLEGVTIKQWIALKRLDRIADLTEETYPHDCADEDCADEDCAE
ncbi:hypothetical protein [Cohnella nanjingensis]|uniref:Uncharacterized protein n=1 Tax=Cohnella nanjingensis TaxID=1387779 RepID=A0A7X0RWU5_9BACL|nr:hypothetical protein [Cohnella nanjingensis]MBB6675153.1 hypothetical protein [Cohnella nanjingensis]